MAHAAQIRVVGTAFLRRRPLVTVPVAMATVALFAWSAAPTKQLLALTLGLGVVQALFIAERIIGARRAISETGLARSLTITAIAVTAGSFISGGLFSPIVPLLLAPSGIAFAAFGRTRISAFILGLVITAATLLALAPLPFPALASPLTELGTATGLIAAAILLRLGVAALADAHAAAAASLARAGDEATLAASTRAKELESLGAKVAHEVKNPLASIRALVEVMIEARGTSEPERNHKRLTVVAGEVERIERILHDYLDFHRPLTALEPADTDVALLMRDVVAVLETRAERAGITLIADGASMPARVDARRLKEAILNLALNALDATSSGQRVELRWKREPDTLQIDIADTGRGMSADQLARVGTTGFTTRVGGTGLGVTLARAVIEQHGGHLTFTSAPGSGTLAAIRLPCPPS